MLTIPRDAVADRWMRLLPGCADEAVRFLDTVIANLTTAHLPGVTWTEESLSASMGKALLGNRRDCVVVRNKHFKEFTIAVVAWGYGGYLHVVRYVVSAPKCLPQIRRFSRFEKNDPGRAQPGSELDVLKTAELDAWIAVVDFCTRSAIESLTGEELPVGDRLTLHSEPQ